MTNPSRRGLTQWPRALLNSLRFRTGKTLSGIYREHLLTSELLARLFPFKLPPILLLSFPRSGSSWIGKILGASPDLAYLREPVHQGFQERFEVPALIHSGEFETDLRCCTRFDAAWLAHYRLCADKAFAGIPPVRAEDVIDDLHDLRFLHRHKKHLLIKEINPFMTEFLVKRYAPRVVFIIRHPAAIADSFERMGWIEGDYEEFGYIYGTSLADAMTSAGASTAATLVYEDVAAAPARQFTELYSALGIRPPAVFEDLISAFCENRAPDDHPYGIRRTSRNEALKWQRQMSREKYEAIMRGYCRSRLPYYRDMPPGEIPEDR